MTPVIAAASSAKVVRFEHRQLPPAGFSFRDMLELRSWDCPGCRLEVDPALGSGDLGQFAMIYEREQPWASWAISRDGGRVLLWDCITLADLGRFNSVRDALDAVPATGEKPPAPLAEVIPFTTMLARRPAA